MTLQSVGDIEGPWQDPDFDSSLIQRCKRYWNVPVANLPNEALATFLRQRFGLELVAPEARRRIELGIDDDSELYDGELAEALRRVENA